MNEREIESTNGQSPVAVIYTDGACSPNPGDGGWGAVIRIDDRTVHLSGTTDDTTNNRMELRAIREALEYLLPQTYRVTLFTDSQYAINVCTGEPTASANLDLVGAIRTVMEFHEVEMHWVEGHSGVVANERADALANGQTDLFD